MAADDSEKAPTRLRLGVLIRYPELIPPAK